MRKNTFEHTKKKPSAFEQLGPGKSLLMFTTLPLNVEECSCDCCVLSLYILHEIFPNTTITKGSQCFFDQLGKVKKEDEGKKTEVNQL